MSGTAKRLEKLETGRGRLVAGVTVPRSELAELCGEELAADFVAARHVFRRHEDALGELV